MGAQHGQVGTKLYNSWRAMLQRSRGHGAPTYAGVRVCEEWHAFPAFRDWALQNGYVDGLTIDRIEGTGHYEPGNCRWADKKLQGSNRFNACVVTIDGETLNVIDWSKRTGIVFSTLYKRYRAGVRGRDFIAPPLHWDSTQVPAVRVR